MIVSVHSFRGGTGKSNTTANTAALLAQQGKLSEAEGHYAEAIKLRADYPEAHNNLGVALARQGKLHEAIGHFTEALRLKNDYIQARANLQFALEEVKKGDNSSGVPHNPQSLPRVR